MKTLLTAFAFITAFIPSSILAQKPKVVWSDKVFTDVRYKMNKILGHSQGVTYKLRLENVKKTDVYLLEKYDSASFRFLGITEISNKTVSKKDFGILYSSIENGQYVFYETYSGIIPDSIIVNKVVLDLKTEQIVSSTPVMRKKSRQGLFRSLIVNPSKDGKILSIVVDITSRNINHFFADMFLHVIDMESNKVLVDFKNYGQVEMADVNEVIEYVEDDEANFAILCKGPKPELGKSGYSICYIDIRTGKFTKCELTGQLPDARLEGIRLYHKRGRFFVRACFKQEEEKTDILKGFYAAEYLPAHNKLDNIQNIQPKELHEKVELSKNGGKYFIPSYEEVVAYWQTSTLGTANEYVVMEGHYRKNIGTAERSNYVSVRSNFFVLCYDQESSIICERYIKAPMYLRPDITGCVQLLHGNDMCLIWTEFKQNALKEPEDLIVSSSDFVLMCAVVGPNDKYKRFIIEDYSGTNTLSYPAVGSSMVVDSNDPKDHYIYLTKIGFSKLGPGNFREGYLIFE